MARTLDPSNENPGEGEPGDQGYTPPTSANSKISMVVSGSNVTITADQIAAAGGPWPTFQLRVTPINDNGSGVPAEAAYPPT